ncbi:hypothetical protein SHIRM173S_10149 [Streptomyces hirsutus]
MVLKPLHRALEDGDPVPAVILGGAVKTAEAGRPRSPHRTRSPRRRSSSTPYARRASTPAPSATCTAPEPAVPGTLRTGPGADSLRERVATALGLPAEEIGDQDSLTALGLDSIMRVELVRWLHDRHGITVPTSELYEHDTLAGLRAYLDTAPPAPEPVTVVAAEAEPEPAQKPEPDLAAIVRTAVERAVDADLGPDGRFTDGALSSLDMLRSVRALETVLGTLPKTLLFDHPDCAALADHLVERFGTPAVARLAGTAPVPSTGSAPGPAAGPGASPSATTPTGPTALVVPRSGLAAHPELSRLVDEVEQRHGMEAGLAGVSIAPLLFFPSTRDGYLAIGRRGDSVLVWRYTGAPERFADAAGELLAYCDRTGLRLNLLSTEPLTDLAGTPMLATAFGVVQRLEDLGSFSLGGGRRSKLRYLVKRFGRHGDNRVEEYVSGSDPETDAAVADLVDRWSEGKQMVNAYVAEARELIRAGKLPERHRIFLTHRDDRLLSAIVLAALPAENGYLLDVEFYPRDMPLGGLEFSLVEIVRRLAAEGAEVLSFGGSFGVEVTSTPNPAEDVRQALAELRSVGIFDEGNYRFKKKFGPVEVPLYLCQPVTGRTDAVDLIMMIANSAESEPGSEGGPGSADEADGDSEAGAPAGAPAAGAPEPDAPAPPAAPSRDTALARAGHNPVLLGHDQVEHDLLTDSWFERTDPFVTDRMAALAARVGTRCGPRPRRRTGCRCPTCRGRRRDGPPSSGCAAPGPAAGEWSCTTTSSRPGSSRWRRPDCARSGSRGRTTGRRAVTEGSPGSLPRWTNTAPTSPSSAWS